MTSVSPLANEKSTGKYALRIILHCPDAGRDKIGEKVPMELKIGIRDEQVTYEIHGLKKQWTLGVPWASRKTESEAGFGAI